ncbi:preprotein translocase subunit SecG [Citroniella saccharovorans]|uniref:Protein-export membrane protein SecG n=1 Tax=Citroniella saccharovorans TaxID=2053367 RepID=A0AAW9MXY4_9FIRM|nr:preprotein translocase subunit SecG [Citroniella saccharovorans]MEB3429435.1 preprotein translocase subunit SecG [Citroniella saccharovorans]
MSTFFTVLLLLASIVIIVAVLMTEPKTQGLGSSYGQDTNIFGHGGKRSKDFILNKVIVGAFIIFLISAVVVTAL